MNKEVPVIQVTTEDLVKLTDEVHEVRRKIENSCALLDLNPSYQAMGYLTDAARLLLIAGKQVLHAADSLESELGNKG